MDAPVRSVGETMAGGHAVIGWGLQSCTQKKFMAAPMPPAYPMEPYRDWSDSAGQGKMAIFCKSAKALAFAFALAFLIPPVVPSDVQAEPVSGVEKNTKASLPNAPTGHEYYIEFRVAQIGTYGHSYVAYGRLSAKGQPADRRFADLHPIGNYALMALGHVVPVPATTKWDPDVEKLPISTSWRRNLTAAQYRQLLAAIQRSRTDTSTTWNAVANNCNHYVAELAKAIGLRTPSNFQVSYTFIPALRDLNEPAGKKDPSVTNKKKQAARE